MQMGLPFREARVAEAPRPLRIGGRVHLVRFVRVRRARRYVIRVKPDGTLRVAVPPFGSLTEAARFVRSQHAWIARERARALRAAAAQPGRAEMAELRKQARRELPARLHELASQHGFHVSRVTIRSQQTLWGSCSRRHAAISINWRLVRMPAAVRDYVLLHELAHLRHPNHSAPFWTLVASVCPWYREALAWLNRHGHSL